MAVVLAGGAGSRLRLGGSEFANLPKPLVEIDFGGTRKPMLEYVVSGLLDHGFGHIAILTGSAPGSGGAAIESFVFHRFRHSPGLRMIREDARHGTGGAVFAAADHLPGEVLLVLPADTLFPFSVLGSALAAHREATQPFTWLVTSDPSTSAQNSGALVVDTASQVLLSSEENGAVPTQGRARVPEGTSARLTSAGAVLLDKVAFLATFADLAAEVDLRAGVDLHRQLLPAAARRRQVRVHDVGVPVPDLGEPERLYLHGRSADLAAQL